MGQILLALRAHDQRIEENLAGLLQLYAPKVPEKVHTFIGIARGESKRIQYWLHEGASGDAQEDVEKVLDGARPRAHRFASIPESESFDPPTPDPIDANAPNGSKGIHEQKRHYSAGAPTLIITGKVNDDGSLDMRTDTVVRQKPDAAGNPGKLNIRRTKARAKNMINNGEGNPLPSSAEKKKRKKGEQKVIERQMRLLREMDEFGDAIRINLLEKSGLINDRILRDLNILEESVREASHHLRADELRPGPRPPFRVGQLQAG